MLVWTAHLPERLSESARHHIDDAGNTLAFSSVSIWEVAIKDARGRPDFQVDAALLRQGLLTAGYHEIAMQGEHAVAVRGLPALHKDPFDRILIAQARVEGATLLTADATMAQYGAPVMLMG